jgi:hypothetical protein
LSPHQAATTAHGQRTVRCGCDSAGGLNPRARLARAVGDLCGGLLDARDVVAVEHDPSLRTAVLRRDLERAPVVNLVRHALDERVRVRVLDGFDVDVHRPPGSVARRDADDPVHGGECTTGTGRTRTEGVPHQRVQEGRLARVPTGVLDTIDFQATDAGELILEALEALRRTPAPGRPARQDLPTEFIPRPWRRLAEPESGRIDRPAYTMCALEALRDGLRRRDIYVAPSERYGDPRAGLLDEPAWNASRTDVCRSLSLPQAPGPFLERLAAELDGAYRRTLGSLHADHPVHELAAGRLHVDQLDALPEPPRPGYAAAATDPKPGTSAPMLGRPVPRGPRPPRVRRGPVDGARRALHGRRAGGPRRAVGVRKAIGPQLSGCGTGRCQSRSIMAEAPTPAASAAMAQPGPLRSLPSAASKETGPGPTSAMSRGDDDRGVLPPVLG